MNWCEMCRDHFERSHWDANEHHLVGAEYGRYGELLAAEARCDELEAAIENYLLWRPGEKGHAAAHRELRIALKGNDLDK